MNRYSFNFLFNDPIKIPRWYISSAKIQEKKKISFHWKLELELANKILLNYYTTLVIPKNSILRVKLNKALFFEKLLELFFKLTFSWDLRGYVYLVSRSADVFKIINK